MRDRRSHRRRAVLAGLAVAATGIALASVPNGVAVGSSSGTSGSAGSSHGGTMFNIAVRADSGNAGALATMLNTLGYDVISRTATVVHVLGGASVQARLAGIRGATVIGHRPAAPQGPLPKAPANQDNILPRKLHGNSYETYYNGYRTAAAYRQFEADLATAYPKLVQTIQFGKTFTGANPLNVVCVTANANKGCQLTPDVTKARFLLMAQIHAREIATSEMAWRFLTRLIDGYKHDAQTTSLLKSTEIWVVPQFNVDGIVTVQDGIKNDGTGDDSPAWQRKNMDEDQTPPGGCGGTWAYSQPGVDLNRNNDFKWGGQGTSQDPCDQEYLGTDPDSETETQALQALFKKLFKDQRGNGDGDAAPKNTTGAMITMHTVAGLVLLPWSFDATVHAPNDAALRSMAFRQSYYNHYETGQSGEVLYNAAGTSDDWSYAALGIASFTWELDGSGACSSFLPAYSCMDAYESNNLPGLYYAAAAARTPYKLSLGPTITAENVKNGSGTVKVTATADDGAYGTSGVGRPTAQKVTDARIYVGKAPWDHGKAQPMTVQGNGTSVTITATVDEGSKKVLAYVQAKDADGNWGPAEAVWIPAT